MIVDAENVSQIDAVTKNATAVAGQHRRDHARVQHDRLEVAELPLQRGRRDRRRPADRERVRQPAARAQVEARIVNSRVDAGGDVVGHRRSTRRSSTPRSRTTSTSIVEMIEGADELQPRRRDREQHDQHPDALRRSTLDAARREPAAPRRRRRPLLTRPACSSRSTRCTSTAASARAARRPPSLSDSPSTTRPTPTGCWINSVSAGGSVTVAADETGEIDANELAQGPRPRGQRRRPQHRRPTCSPRSSRTTSTRRTPARRSTSARASWSASRDGYAGGGVAGRRLPLRGLDADGDVHRGEPRAAVPRTSYRTRRCKLPARLDGHWRRPAATYKFVGTAAQGLGLDLSTADYADTLCWLRSLARSTSAPRTTATRRAGRACSSARRSTSSRPRPQHHRLRRDGDRRRSSS